MLFFFSTVVQAEGFKTPSGNIECVVGTSDEYQVVEKVLDCTIFSVTNDTDNCGINSPRIITIYSTGTDGTSLSCAGQRSSKKLPTVDYGKTWQSGEFSCSVEKSGVACKNQDGAELFLSKARQQWGND